MGMYTEIFIVSDIKKGISEVDLNVLKFLFCDSPGSGETEPTILPKHEFFTLPRWQSIGRCSSFYHIPFVVNKLKYDNISKQYYLASLSNIKNYNGEIEAFFDWFDSVSNKEPGCMMGYSRYEEDLDVVCYYKKGSSDE